MKRHFLHLSDLHFRAERPEQVDLVTSRLFDDLRLQAKAFPDSLLIFSGDLVQAGGEPGLFGSFKSTFATELTKAGFPPDRRISIPGNHDVSRVALKPNVTLQQGALSAMVDESTFNDNFDQLAKQYFAPTFESYRACEQDFAAYGCCAEGLGGHGWDLSGEVGIYCLNTALCSYGGIEDSSGKKIDDKNKLMIDTRSLHRWAAQNRDHPSILVMHHPVEWLAEWARSELEHAIFDYFRLVVCGHVHEPSSAFASQGQHGVVTCIAPALYTHKSEPLGYSYITIDDDSTTITYRQWSPSSRTFVAGSVFSGTDTGVKRFPRNVSGEVALAAKPTADSLTTLALLQEEFDEAITSYSSKKRIWVERDLGSAPEPNGKGKDSVQTTTTALSAALRSCIIRAPRQFGLTCVGRFLALEHAKRGATGTLVMLDVSSVPTGKDSITRLTKRRCKELQIAASDIAGLVLDNWQNEKRFLVILQELRLICPDQPIVILHSIDDVSEIMNPIKVDELNDFDHLHLWSMTRARIRELVSVYVSDIPTLEDSAVTKKVLEEIDALNLHRTPLNCLTILKLLEQHFDDSPVNRTEMISRVLQLLFFEFHDIPRYSTRPDLKDCERALGYFTEWLVNSQRMSFSKADFASKVKEFCDAQLVDLDAEILFRFLMSENIFIRRGSDFEFRFRYWIYYFAAHRMYHAEKFRKFILTGGRYSAFPEIMEFYAGIDRAREDAVIQLTADLRQMNAAFLKRTNIPEEFEPWRDAQWVPSQPVVDHLLKEVTDNAADSALPTAVKDAIADKHYDPSTPYNQELAKFLNEASLRQMMSTMQAAARALRNSDYVDPKLKMQLMEEVVSCWQRICQILAILSPLLAEHGSALFEGINFLLDDSWDDIRKEKLRFDQILSAIPFNIAYWYQDDISSKKMGLLYAKYLALHPGSLNEALILMIMVMQRSPGWEKEVEAYIDRTKKNSFYLCQIFGRLFGELRTSVTNEKTRQQLRRLAAKAIAKHEGAKHPSPKVVERRAKGLDKLLDEKNNGPQNP